MASQAEYKINISPTQLMGFTFAMMVAMMGMVYMTTSMVVNGQAAYAHGNGASNQPQYVVAEDDGGFPTCVEADVAGNSNADAEASKTGNSVVVGHGNAGGYPMHAVGNKVMLGGKPYRVVEVHATTRVHEDNDTTVRHTTTVDNRHSGNTTVDNRNSGNTNVDNRNSGNTDNRWSGNTTNRNNGNTDNRWSGNTTNRNNGNTDNRWSGNTDNRNSGNSWTRNNTSTTVDNRWSGNTLNHNNGNTTNSGNSNAQNNGNSWEWQDNDTTVNRNRQHAAVIVND